MGFGEVERGEGSRTLHKRSTTTRHREVENNLEGVLRDNFGHKMKSFRTKIRLEVRETWG